MKKKLISAALALVMVIGLLPMTVFADDTLGNVNLEVTDVGSFTNENAFLEHIHAKFPGTIDTVTSGGPGEGEGVMFVRVSALVPEGKTLMVNVLDSQGNLVNNKYIAGNTGNLLYWKNSFAADRTYSVNVGLYDGQYSEESAPYNEDDVYWYQADGTWAKGTKVPVTVTPASEAKYQGYTLSAWITDMASKHSAFSSEIQSNAVTLTDDNFSKFLDVYANSPVFEAIKDENLGHIATAKEKEQVAGWKTVYEDIKKMDASGLSTTKLSGIGTLKFLTGLEELNVSGQNPASSDGSLEPDALWAKLKVLNLSNSNVTNIDQLKGNTNLTTLDISETGVANLNALETCTGLTTLDAKNLTTNGGLDIIGLLTLINEGSFDTSKIVRLDFTGTTVKDNLTDEQKLVVNRLIDTLGNKLVGLTKYDVVVPTVYTITVETNNANAGTATASATTAAAGTEVTITATAKEGFEFQGIIVTAADGTKTPYQGQATFAMPAGNVTVQVVFKAKGNAAYAETGVYGGTITLSGLTAGKKYVCQMAKADTAGNEVGANAIVVFTAASETHTIPVLKNDNGGYSVSLWAYPTAEEITDISQLVQAFYEQHVQ